MINTRNLLAEALRQRMSELGLSEPGLAELLQLSSRDAVSAWRSGRNWPRPPGERTLEDVIQVPRGFFARIGNGESYESAMTPQPFSESDENLTAVDQYKQLLLLSPTNSEAQKRLTQVREHLQQQVSLFLEMLLAERSFVSRAPYVPPLRPPVLRSMRRGRHLTREKTERHTAESSK